jgi:iron complex transport system substrate-binding protein
MRTHAALIGAIAFLLVACGGQSDSPAEQQRIVSLVPSATEVVYALGAGDRLVGNTTMCDYPDAARAVPKVADFQRPDMAAILALEPSLVVLALPIHRVVAERLAEAGIRYYASNPQTLTHVFTEIESIGQLLGLGQRARLLADSLRTRLDSLPQWPDTPSVYLEISETPLMTVGGGTYVNDVVRAAGGRNVYADAAQQYPVVDPEDLVLRDPQVIVLLHCGTRVKAVGRRVGWSRVSAIRTGRVYDDIDDDLLVRPGPRVVDGVMELGRRLHTED